MSNKKSIFKKIGSLGIALMLILFSANSFSQIDLPELPEDGAPNALRCRCHSNIHECLGGNWISFRPKCAQFNDGQGDCTKYSVNCP